MSRKKIALVTGANRGLGTAIAEGLEARGCLVYRGVRDGDGEVAALSVDISSRQSIERAKSEFSSQHGHLDILINNAGVNLDGDTEVRRLTEDVLRETLEVNLLGAFRVTNGLIACLKRAPSARVINVSSRMGQLSTMDEETMPAYSVSKAALNALTVQQAHAYKPFGVAVNCMCPGWVRTDMGGADATKSPEEGADTVVWLALDADHSLTGRFWADREEVAW